MDGTTAATIPIRDANGRMQAADPASGATDKTLVTANWVSQTGNTAPNNLVHRTGAEKLSNKSFDGTLPILSGVSTNPSGSNAYRNIFTFRHETTNYLGAIMTVEYRPNGTTMVYLQVRNSDGTIKNVILASGNVI